MDVGEHYSACYRDQGNILYKVVSLRNTNGLAGGLSQESI